MNKQVEERKKRALESLLTNELGNLSTLIRGLHEQRGSTMADVWEQFDLIAALRADIEPREQPGS